MAIPSFQGSLMNYQRTGIQITRNRIETADSRRRKRSDATHIPGSQQPRCLLEPAGLHLDVEIYLFVGLRLCACCPRRPFSPVHGRESRLVQVSVVAEEQPGRRGGAGLFLGCHDIITGHLRISLVREEDEGFGRSV